MKKIILLLALIPTLVFGQERQQKLNFRSHGSIAPRTFTPSPSPSFQQRERITQEQPPMYRGESYQKQNWRRQREENRFHNGGTPRYYYNDPFVPYWGWYDYNFWRWNRWNSWGAPLLGWNYWEPNWYYDNWGYRQPSRVYVYKDGKVDTIKGQKVRVSLGLQGNQSEMGGFLTLGGKTFFIAEYQRSYQRDRSTFYSDLTRDVVIPWDDKRSTDIKKGSSVFAGVGQRFGRTGVFGALGVVNERNRYQYFDELYILSNNGYYSFPNYRDAYIALKFGVLHDLKGATLKLDYEPNRNLITGGLGVNF